MKELYLNIGCGEQLIDGFINIDLDEHADLQQDVTKGLSFDDCSVDGIYSEHFIEHIDQGQGHAFMRECARVLKPGGKVRIATPDLDVIVARYSTDEWMGSGMKRHGFHWVDNPCEMLNIAMREWGHQWVYNETELTRLGYMAGFRLVGRMAINESTEPMLANRETRPESLLILEFEKPDRQLASDAEPLVSVLIAAYNPRYFAEALRSAMEQTYRNLEILISDDCPTDAIEKLVGEMAADDVRVKYSRRENRDEPRGNYLRLVQLATGEFIKFLNDDDVLESACIELMLNAFRTTRDLTLVTSNRQFVDSDGVVMEGPHDMVKFVSFDQVIQGSSLIAFTCAMRKNYTGEPTTFMFRREDVINIQPNILSYGGEQMPGIGDVAMAVNLMGKGNVYFYSKPLSRFRQHHEQRQRKGGIYELAIASWENLARHVKRLGYRFDSEQLRLSWRLPDDSFWQSRNLVREQPLTYSESYEKWREKHFIRDSDVKFMVNRMVEQWGFQPSIHLIVCVDEQELEPLAKTLESLSQQVYSAWGLTVISPALQPDPVFDEAPNLEWLQVEGSPFTFLNRVVETSGADWLVLMSPGDTLEPTAMLRLADRANFFPGKFFFYCDEDIQDANGEYVRPSFKPQFSLDLLRSSPYMGSGCMVRRELVAEVGGLSDLPGVTNHDIALKFYEHFSADAFVHIADVLYHKYEGRVPSDVAKHHLDADTLKILNQHLQRCNLDAKAMQGYETGSYRIQYNHQTQPLVSIVVPTRNNLAHLRGCLTGLMQKTAYSRYEILVVDNGSEGDELLAYYEDLVSSADGKFKVLSYDRPYNYSAMCNFAVSQASGDYILLLNDNTQVVHSEWLDRMMSHAQREEVGAVGARLLNKDSTINHAGMILGMDGIVGYPGFGCSLDDESAFMGRAKLEQNLSAVDGSCLLVRKSYYAQVGGLNEDELKHSFSAVDFCLRLLVAGYNNVYTPFASVLHFGVMNHEEISGDKVQRALAERDYMLDKWLPLLADDPFYNENLALRSTDVVVDSQLPLRWERCIHDRPRIVGVPLTDTAVGDLRVIAPLNAMDNQGIVQTLSTPPLEGSSQAVTQMPSVIEMARISPDVLLMQSPVQPHQISQLERYRKYLKETFMVYDLEDYKFAPPKGHPQHNVFPKDMRERLQRSFNQCDRLLVSSEKLVEDYYGMIDDIRYVPNYLSRKRWEGHRSLRRYGRKPRVGWAGAQQHHTDLAIVAPVVKALADEVEWVFMGMCIDEIKPYVSEIHPAVTYTAYPEKLASLNLDLAIAPLENNIFNQAKSNLRLLEFGVMGWPVVCTDIDPYRYANAPVKRVENSQQAWVDAIRERINDLDAAYAEGDALKQWVLGNFMLEDNLDTYLGMLLPQ